MKIVVSASGNTLDSAVDPRFGRCAYFAFVDPDSLAFETLANESAMASGGAGIQAAQFVATHAVEAVITGNVGPNASMTLNAAGIQIFLGVTGTVRDAVESYKQGNLQPATGPSVPGHFGMGQAGAGLPRGGGMGGGMARGMGMGAGRGFAQGGMAPAQPSSPAGNAQQGLETLKSQMTALQDQMKEIAEKIENLEKRKK